jgi:hypothetical protein
MELDAMHRDANTISTRESRHGFITPYVGVTTGFPTGTEGFTTFQSFLIRVQWNNRFFPVQAVRLSSGSGWVT